MNIEYINMIKPTTCMSIIRRIRLPPPNCGTIDRVNKKSYWLYLKLVANKTKGNDAYFIFLIKKGINVFVTLNK